MKAYIPMSLLGLFLLVFLSSKIFKTDASIEPIQTHQLAIKKGRYFNPQEFYQKQCVFCHNARHKIAPSMGHIKKAYIKAYPKKETFIKKMTAFILEPINKNRLIKDNLNEYKKMPPNLFFDQKRITKVAEHIYKNVSVPTEDIVIAKSKLAHKKKLSNDNAIEVKWHIEKGDDLCKILNLKPVDFKYAKSTITPNMAKQLDKIVVFLKDNPKINLEICNYTDARGSAQHNLELSNKRALATKAYLIGHGIRIDRIKAKGFGETKLLNRCKDGVKCSDAEHRQNRRTEMIVF